MDSNSKFAIFAEIKDYDSPLIMTGLTFGRLIDDIVIPYEEKKPLFIDGVLIVRDNLRKIKIVKEAAGFDPSLGMLHRNMRMGSVAGSKLLVEQYHIRLEALLREFGEDVTSQVIKAYDTAIKPKLTDYLPKRAEIIEAGMKVLFEGLKSLGGG